MCLRNINKNKKNGISAVLKVRFDGLMGFEPTTPTLAVWDSATLVSFTALKTKHLLIIMEWVSTPVKSL
jgi:hypothetical protein